MSPPLRLVTTKLPFDPERLVHSAPGATIATFRPMDIIFAQGDPSRSVMYLQEGAVKLSVLSRSGKEAVIALLEESAFFGESALAGRRERHEVATAMTAATVLVIPKLQMMRLLHERHEFAHRFIAHMLARNIRIEEDVVDQLFNSGERRLARALLLLAHYGTPHKTRRVRLRISQQTIAAMVGTTRSRVSFFMNKFRKLGYIEYSGGLTVNDSLATVILGGEQPVAPAGWSEEALRPIRRVTTEPAGGRPDRLP